MAGCCSVPADHARRLTGPSTCPACGKKGNSVRTRTVKSLVRDHRRVSAEASYWFCKMPECNAVYFSPERAFEKSDLKVRLGLKEHDDPVPLCYCFDYTRADVRRDIETRGTTDIPDRIKAEIEAGFCACEVKNPSGNCCLGDIVRAIKETEALARSRH